MTWQELTSRRDAFERAKWRRLLPRLLALLVPVVFLPMGVAAYLRAAGASDWVALALGVAGAPAWAGYGDLMLARLRRAHGVVCPHCHRALVSRTGALTLTGGRCGGCGAVLVADAAEPGAAADRAGVSG